ncbi:arginyl-tRNA--protein transferase 1-like [Amblyraja radiata]|uniref:arginyl-tRNA--protein transferase 1-like n=1 Tax=Amblyraja radiata TaxID=386614 RepID=UPI0014033C37|nr:arginyl-tRNA--protein transferase 1-like [Amblyraja radiata]
MGSSGTGQTPAAGLASELRPPLEAWSCGYCGKDSFCAQGLMAHKLSVHDYQLLLNKGWVRSGKYLYKAAMPITCCPTYPMRCHVLDFRISRSQRRVLKKMRKHLTQPDAFVSETVAFSPPEDTTCHKEEQVSGAGQGKLTTGQTPWTFPEGSDENWSEVNHVTDQRSMNNSQAWSVEDPAPHIHTCRKAKESRGELLKTPERGQQAELEPAESELVGLTEHKAPGQEPAPLQDPQPSLSQTSMSAVHPSPIPPPLHSTSQPNRTRSLEELLVESTPVTALHQLEVKLLRLSPPSPELQSTFGESYKVYKRYQMHVHKDTELMASEAEYRRFFCSTPLLGEDPADGPDTGYGSFIEQFLLAGKIIALGLLDILPEGINSQYLCYDPDYSSLSLGVYSALREIALTQRLNEKVPRMKYYYLGPYVHSCVKVKYKLFYQPTELLCPVTGHWVSVEQCLPKLELSKFARLYDGEEPAVDCGLSNEGLWFLRNFRDALSPSSSASVQTEEAMLVVSQEDLVSIHSSSPSAWWKHLPCLARLLSCCCRGSWCRKEEES